MILMGSGMGVVIEAWKVRPTLLSAYSAEWLVRHEITKAVDVKLVASQPGSILPWKVIFAGKPWSTGNGFAVVTNSPDKHVLSEDEKKTQE
jgi:hypothetical protein